MPLLKRFYREGDNIRLQPSNTTMAPIIVPKQLRWRCEEQGDWGAEEVLRLRARKNQNK